jgi:hypothetical protein
VVESILNYGCEIWTVDCRLKKKLLSTETDFWRIAAKTSRILKVRNEVCNYRKKMGVTQFWTERKITW